MHLITLGPLGTFSHEAATLAFPDAQIALANNFDQLFEQLQDNPALLGFVPIENSLHGSVDEILDLLRETKARLRRTYDVAIQHSFGALEVSKIKAVASHPQALRQCRKWLKKHHPTLEHMPMRSTAAAIDHALKDSSIAAIALAKSMMNANLPVIAEDIEGADNTTRFGIVALIDPFPDLKRTQLMIMLHPHEDYPGLLHKLLTPFKIYDVNMTRIENRPVGSKLGDYFFYIDFLGRRNDPGVKKVMEELEQLAEVEVLGEW